MFGAVRRNAGRLFMFIKKNARLLLCVFVVNLLLYLCSIIYTNACIYG